MLEHQTWHDQGFEPAETSLANMMKSQGLVQKFKVTHLLSYLGRLNPIPIGVSKNDAVWLFDNVAFRGPNGTWQAEFVTAVFDARVSTKFVEIVGDIAEKVGLSKGDKQEKTIEQRITPFLMEVLPGRRVDIKFGESTALRLGPGGRNGVSSDLKKLPDSAAGTVVKSAAEVPSGAGGLLEMNTFYTEPKGWAVISGMLVVFGPSFDRETAFFPHTNRPMCASNTRSSKTDVDDTIKITQTSDPVGILRSTFVVSLAFSAFDDRPRTLMVSHPSVGRADANRRHARAILANQGHGDAVCTVVLSVGITIQPLPFPPELHSPLLSPGPVDPARCQLDDHSRVALQSYAGNPKVQGRSHEEAVRVATKEEDDLYRRFNAKRPRSIW